MNIFEFENGNDYEYARRRQIQAVVTTLVLAEKSIQPRLALVQEMDSAVVLLLAKVDNWSNRGLPTIVGPPAGMCL